MLRALLLALLCAPLHAQNLPFTFHKSDDSSKPDIVDASSLEQDLDYLYSLSKQNKVTATNITVNGATVTATSPICSSGSPPNISFCGTLAESQVTNLISDLNTLSVSTANLAAGSATTYLHVDGSNGMVGQFTVNPGTVSFYNTVMSIGTGGASQVSFNGGNFTMPGNASIAGNVDIGLTSPSLIENGGSGVGIIGFNYNNGQAPWAGTGFIEENNQGINELLFYSNTSTGATGTPSSSAITLAIGNAATPSVAVNTTVLNASNFNVNGSAQFGGSGGSISTFNAAGFLTIANNSGIAFSGGTSAITGVSSVTAGAFFGSGAGLTGLPSAVCTETSGHPGAIQCNGSDTPISTATTTGFAGPGSNLVNNAGGGTAFGLTNVSGGQYALTVGESNNSQAIGGIALGRFNFVSNQFSGTALGYKSSATTNGDFVWSDYEATSYFDHGANTFNVRGSSAYLDVPGGVWIDTGSLNVLNSSVTASAFFGDGSHLSGLPGGGTVTGTGTSGKTAVWSSGSGIQNGSMFDDGAGNITMPASSSMTFLSSVTIGGVFTSTLSYSAAFIHGWVEVSSVTMTASSGVEFTNFQTSYLYRVTANWTQNTSAGSFQFFPNDDTTNVSYANTGLFSDATSGTQNVNGHSGACTIFNSGTGPGAGKTAGFQVTVQPNIRNNVVLIYGLAVSDGNTATLLMQDVGCGWDGGGALNRIAMKPSAGTWTGTINIEAFVP